MNQVSEVLELIQNITGTKAQVPTETKPEKNDKKDKKGKKEGKTSGNDSSEVNLKDLNQLLSTNMFTEGDIPIMNDATIVNQIKNQFKEKDLEK